MSGIDEHALDHLRKTLREHMNNHTDSMAQGACEDHAQYRYLCGVIHGLAMAERELLDIKKVIEQA